MVKQIKEEVEIDLVVNPKTYNFLLNSTARKTHLFGGAGSGKSWALGQFLVIEKMLDEHDIRMVITRKTGPALMKSCWLLIRDMLHKYDIPFEENITDRVIRIGSNEMYFVSLDDPEKLKSFEKINYVWAEEATELTKSDYMQLGLRCRGENPNGDNALYFSYNPVAKPYNRYLQEITQSPPKNTSVLHTTYKDNAFLSEEYIEEIEILEETDDIYWKIYGKGEWAAAKNLIYSNWDTVTNEEFEAGTLYVREIGYGLDFGFNAQSALCKMWVDEERKEIWVKQEIFESKLTNTKLIERCNEIISDYDRRYAIVADCAEPDRIEEFQKAGFNVFPCTKGKHSVKIGIDRVKRYKIHILEDSQDIIDEISLYKWKEDVFGNSLDIPVPYYDHLLDAIRYYMGELRCGIEPDLTVIGNLMGN